MIGMYNKNVKTEQNFGIKWYLQHLCPYFTTFKSFLKICTREF